VAIPILRGIQLYAFAVWAYLAANSISHPGTMRMPLTHFVGWPHENTAAVGCALSSVIAFFYLRLIETRQELGRRGPSTE
jgi:predicted Kef-type K+ transport protein